jgi:hypothetical protein
MAGMDPWAAPAVTLAAAADSSPEVDEAPARETGSDPGGASPIVEIGGRERCELGTPTKCNAKLKRPRARASAMRMRPTIMAVIPRFVLPKNALSCVPILFFMSTGAVGRSVTWSRRSTARGALSAAAK